MRNLVAVFREEGAEILDRLADALSRIPQTGSPDELRAVAYECMRHAHNLKGASASVGLGDFSRKAHALEDGIGRIAKAEAEAQPSPGLLAGLIAATDDLRRELRDLDAPAARAAPAFPGGAPRDAGAEPARTAPAPAPAAASVRVSAERLDRVMGHAEELLSIQSRERSLLDSLRGVVDRAAQEGNPSLSRALEDHLRSAEAQSAGLERLVHDLGGALRELRMIPVSSVAPAWQRAVRDAARAVGRSVRLDVALGDLEIDKTVLDLIQDPVIHLLRNAVDHGVEGVEERARRGKPPAGRIEITGEIHGPSLVLSVCDDGRGLDVEALRAAAGARARAAGAPAAALGDEEVIDLIFAPGFSTRSEVSAISGRGVGLDAVREAMAALGGQVRVSPHGRLGGAGFELEVPLSVLSARGLIVEAGGTVVAIPIEAVERTLEVASSAVVDLDGVRVARLGDGEPLPVASLGEALGRGRAAPSKALKLVVIERGGRRLGLAVDGVRGESEFVTRRLPWNLRAVRGVSGAIVQPDGSVALFLDVAGTMEGAGRCAGDRAAGERPGGPDRGRSRILVVDDSLTARTLHRNTLLAAGYEVSTASDGAEALRMLENEPYAMLVSDVEMPVLDGIELTRRVRANEKLRDLPVILVTSRSRPTDVERGTAAGADEYIVKGTLDQQKLLDAVARRL